jgi:hypothetical protein
MTEQCCPSSHPNPPAEVTQKFQLAFSQAEIILQTLSGRDYHGDNRGLNETGFKVAVIAGLLQQGFVVASEVEVGNGCIDLLAYATSHPTLKFILELKYVRGGFIKSISDRIRAREFGNIYNAAARESNDLSLALNEVASNLKAMTKDELKLVEWYEYKRKLVSVEEKVQRTLEIQLKRYYEEFKKTIKEGDHLYGLLLIGVVNKIHSEFVDTYSNNVCS